MRALLWVIGIFALAAGLVAIARYNTGYVLLVVPPYRVEVSLNLLATLLLAAFAAVYAVGHFVAGVLRLPARVHEYRTARRREQLRAELLRALTAFFCGQYRRAEQAAQKVELPDDDAKIAAVVAAHAAHALRAPERCDAHLARIPEGDPLRQMTAASLLLEQRRPDEALQVMGGMRHKHTAALLLELKAQELVSNWEQVLLLVHQLERRGALPVEQARRLLALAHTGNLQRKAADRESLEAAWKKVPEGSRHDSRVAAGAARCFLHLGESVRARQIIESSLNQEWDSRLAGLYADCAGADTVRLIECAEGWLRQHPRDASLLLALGRLCVQQELWGKAEAYLDASIAVEPTWEAHQAAAGLAEKLGREDAARRHHRSSLKLALMQLEARRERGM